jgi:hypothetical protein
MLDPPVSLGAVQKRLTSVSPALALTAVGAAGVVNGVTLDDTDDVGPVPFALIAATRNV